MKKTYYKEAEGDTNPAADPAATPAADPAAMTDPTSSLGASNMPPMGASPTAPSLDSSLGTDPLGGGLDPQGAENKPVEPQKIEPLNVWDLLSDYVKNKDRQDDIV